jgi:hypothetical protein
MYAPVEKGRVDASPSETFNGLFLDEGSVLYIMGAGNGGL